MREALFKELDSLLHDFSMTGNIELIPKIKALNEQIRQLELNTKLLK